MEIEPRSLLIFALDFYAIPFVCFKIITLTPMVGWFHVTTARLMGAYEGDETQVVLDPALANDLSSSTSSGTCTIPDSRLSINGLR